MARWTETHSAATLRLRPASWRGHRAGQHVDIRLTAEDGYQAERSYSIASPPNGGGADGTIDVTIERLEDGEVSAYLVDEMQPGDLLEVRGPIGGWFVWDVADGGPLLLLAGGSGIVPVMAMVRHRHQQGSDVRVRMVVSVRTEEDLFYAAELTELAAAGDGFELVVTVTRGEPAAGHRAGRLDAALLDEMRWNGGRAYACGPNGFVETATGLLVAAGMDPAEIRAERFGPSGI
ncbi:MAG TPA: FAD-binding oxidoreductase [Actinomycetota bacterium]|nr:FAD-binding oxidoreductase [Actinomycetota bacterium]